MLTSTQPSATIRVVASKKGTRDGQSHSYSRTSNPTRNHFAGTLAELECGAGATIVSSGTAAVDLVLGDLRPGYLVVAPHDCYSGISRSLNFRAAMGRFKVMFVDPGDADALDAAFVTMTHAGMTVEARASSRDQAHFVEIVGRPRGGGRSSPRFSAGS